MRRSAPGRGQGGCNETEANPAGIGPVREEAGQASVRGERKWVCLICLSQGGAVARWKRDENRKWGEDK
jgi:hypothetical protein